MNEIIDTIVGNNVVFGGILVLLGIILLVLIISIVKSSKKNRKIPIYEEDLEDKELEKVKEKNIIDKPEIKKKKKKKKIEKPVETEKVDNPKEEETTEEIPNPQEEEEPEQEEKSIENSDLEDSKEEEQFPQQELDTIYSDGEPEEIIDEGYSEEKIAELENIDEDEIKERIDKEHEEAIEETMEEIDNEEMADILQNLKEAKEMKPEDVVRQFEQEQEAQSIISYQELVDVVKNRDKDFEDELESKPLATVSDFLPESSKEEQEDTSMTKIIEELGHSKEEIETSSEKKEETPSDVEMEKEDVKKEIPTDGKFKKTELISPVFGRIEETPKDSYPTVKKFSHEEKENLIEEIALPEVEKDDTIETEAEEIDSFEDISEELEEEKNEALFEEIPAEEKLAKTSDLGKSNLSKNEEFLKALKDFRDSL